MLYADVEQLGRTQSMLANGALLARDVPIARTGVQHYHVSEIAGALDDDTAIDAAGMVQVLRDADDVFDARSVASFEGAAITLGHPDGQVDPDSWGDLAVGHIQNVRQAGDRLLADLVIHSARGITAVRRDGWRAVSCGYDANYVPLSDGRLRQIDIRANHVALLQPSEMARCGPLCAVGDAAWHFGGNTMHIHDQYNAPGYSVSSRSDPGGVRAMPGERSSPASNPGGVTGSVRSDYQAARSTERTGGGLRPGSGIGPKIVMELPGPASAYEIRTWNGKTVLVRHSDVEGVLDPGRTVGTADVRDFQRIARERAAHEQAATARMAAGVTAFWKKQAGGHG